LFLHNMHEASGNIGNSNRWVILTIPMSKRLACALLDENSDLSFSVYKADAPSSAFLTLSGPSIGVARARPSISVYIFAKHGASTRMQVRTNLSLAKFLRHVVPV